MHVCSGIICVTIHHGSLFRAAENRSVQGVDRAFRYSTGITFPVIVMEPVCSTRRDQMCQLSQLLSIIKPGAITTQNIVITEVILIGFTLSLMLHVYTRCLRVERTRVTRNQWNSRWIFNVTIWQVANLITVNTENSSTDPILNINARSDHFTYYAAYELVKSSGKIASKNMRGWYLKITCLAEDRKCHRHLSLPFIADIFWSSCYYQ
jgi:hypothetical protein